MSVNLLGTPILDLYRNLKYKSIMEKERPDMEEFAAMMADKEDNPTIHELAKAFPEKTYKELESYRNADRHEEANQIPLTEAQKNLVEHIEAGTCIMGEMKKDRTSKHKVIKNLPEENIAIMESPHRESLEDKYEKEHKLRQEAEGELSIMKGIETNRVKEAQARCDHLQSELDRTKKENNNLFNRVAELIEIDESHQRLNGKLQVRIAELEDDNKKLAHEIDDRIDRARKAGL